MSRLADPLICTNDENSLTSASSNDHEVIDSVEVTGVKRGSPNRTLRFLFSFNIRNEIANVDLICSNTSPSKTDLAVLVRSNGSESES